MTFITQLGKEQASEEVWAKAKLVLLDTLGAILAGSQAPENLRLAEYASGLCENGSASLFGQAAKADAGWAALVNATAGTATELDEGHAYARGHPAIHVLPTALALGEVRHATGAQVLHACIMGYEVAARVGAATDLRRGVHPHGTWGTLGAATAASLLLEHDYERTLEAIRIASSLTLSTSFESAIEGALVRNLYAGVSNQLGILAANLAALGFSGEREGVERMFGQISGQNFNPAELVDQLGKRYEIQRGYFKIHSCCRYNHAALDALLKLRELEQFAVEEVKEIVVETYNLAARLNSHQPQTTLAARFSIPYALAIALVREDTSPMAFDERALQDERIRSLAERVKVREEPSLTNLLPDRRSAIVQVQLKDGRSLKETVYKSRGDPGLPLEEHELVEKFLSLASPVIGAKQAQDTLRAVRRVEELDDIAELTTLMCV